MTIDYKNISAEKSGMPPLKSRLMFFFGLTLGLVVALAVHFYHLRQPPSVAPSSAAVSEGAADKDRETGAEESYGFFDILPTLDIEVPEYQEVDAARRASYILQAGSFRSRNTAEVLREKLIVFELESEVREVTSGDGNVWYIVRLGPYDSLSQANNIKINLRKQGIESLMKKN